MIKFERLGPVALLELINLNEINKKLYMLKNEQSNAQKY